MDITTVSIVGISLYLLGMSYFWISPLVAIVKHFLLILRKR